MHPDGRITKLLVLGDQEWAIRARDLGAHVLLMSSDISLQEVEVIIIQEGCHGVVFGGEYQLDTSNRAQRDLQLAVPSWDTSADPEEVLNKLQQGA